MTASAHPEFKIPFGIDVIDRVWGGVYRGGTYLIYGRAALGRTLISLQFARTGVERGETCMFISPARPKDLMIQAASIGFDLRTAYEKDQVRLFRIPPTLNVDTTSDASLVSALNDLIMVIQEYEPDRLVIDDFTPFVQFRSFNHFKAAFTQMLEQLSLLDTTTLLGMGEPASERARQVIEFISSQITGTIHIEEDEEHPGTTWRKISLIPNVGQIQSPVTLRWDLASIIHEEEHYEPSARVLPGAATTPQKREPEVIGRPPITPIPLGKEETQEKKPLPGVPFGPSMEELARKVATEEAPATTAPSPTVAPGPAAAIPTPAAAPAPTAPAVTPATVAWTPPVMPGAPSPSPTGPSPLEQFRQKLAQAFANKASQPFFLVALRLNPTGAPIDFQYLAELVHTATRRIDEVYIDPAKQRIIIYMPASTQADVRQFFHRLSTLLRQRFPEQGDLLERSVASIVAPDGEPFQDADAFLNFVLE